YLDILKNHTVSSGKRINGRNFVFMHDDDFKHSAKVCIHYLRELETNNDIKIMRWLPQSSDFNPIEKL
ncbi:hypothetical protein WH47_08388, partial [Habropoda laboriosa]